MNYVDFTKELKTNISLMNGYNSPSFIQLAVSRLEAYKKTDPYPIIFIKCAECGNDFKIRKSEVRKKTCSWACRVKYMRGQNAPSYKKGGFKKGKDNPKYKGLNNNHDRVIYRDKINTWRRLIFYRDKYLCQRCHTNHRKSYDLRAHHIAPWVKFPDLRFKVDNGITLCRKCHEFVHSKLNVNKEFLKH